MNRLQRAAILAELAERLTLNGSWCGQTHLVKSAYFLQELLDVPTGYNFTFYKFGPYAFDVSEDLSAMEADKLIKQRVRNPAYGPTLVPTDESKSLRERYPVTLGKYDRKLDFISRKLGDKKVSDLERLSTAMYVTKELGQVGIGERARRICELKPHVSNDEARAAVREYDQIAEEAAALSD